MSRGRERERERCTVISDKEVRIDRGRGLLDE